MYGRFPMASGSKKGVAKRRVEKIVEVCVFRCGNKEGNFVVMEVSTKGSWCSVRLPELGEGFGWKLIAKRFWSFVKDFTSHKSK